MSKEDPAAVIAAAGDRLGYVHLDDNDGEGDLHWSLLEGVLTEKALAATFAALALSQYTGPASLEPQSPTSRPRGRLNPKPRLRPASGQKKVVYAYLHPAFS